MKFELETNKNLLHYSKEKVQRQSFQKEEDIEQLDWSDYLVCSLKG